LYKVLFIEQCQLAKISLSSKWDTGPRQAK